MAVADKNNIELDLSSDQDGISGITNTGYQSDSGNLWQLPNLPHSPSNHVGENKELTTVPADSNQRQSVQQPLTAETSNPLNAGGEQAVYQNPVLFVNSLGGLTVTTANAETAMSQQMEVRHMFTITTILFEIRNLCHNTIKTEISKMITSELKIKECKNYKCWLIAFFNRTYSEVVKRNCN